MNAGYKNKMIKILKETRDWYEEDPDNRRSMDEDGQCMYTWGDQHCAVGRYMKDEYQDESFPENNESVNQLYEHAEDMGEDDYGIDWVLREEVHGLDSDFWRDLQEFHDSDNYWITETSINMQDFPKGISPDGIARYNSLLNKIEKGTYDG